MREFAASFEDRTTLHLSFWFDEQDRQTYDSFEIWKSPLGEGGPYFPLMSQTWQPAPLTGIRVPGALAGKSMSLLVGAEELTIVFAGPDPISLSSVAAQIEAAAPGLLRAAASDNVTLTISSVHVGSQARLEITGGDAAILLGFSIYPPTNTAYGKSVRPKFVTDVGIYFFEDTWWQQGCAYKMRAYNSATDSYSEFSNAVIGNATRAVTSDKLVRAWLRLVDFQGRPVSGRTILFATRGTRAPNMQGELLVDASDLALKTDDDGVCSLLVLRGVSLTVGIAGTAIVRDVITPTDTTIDSFNLLDSTYGSDDAFSVQVPRIDLAQRRECE